MPIYKRSYRNYEGHFQRRFRWWIVAQQELRILFVYKVFIFLFLLGMFGVLLRFLQILAYDIVVQDVNNPLSPMLKQVDNIAVDKRMFFEFIRMQIPITFLTMLYAGAGMICNDFRNNLMEVYFSKPLNWRDYVMGKCITLILIGFSFTAIPAILLVILHNAFMPSWELLQESWWWPLAILGFSIVVVLPMALTILASSALMRTHGFAAIAIFMIIAANSFTAVTLAFVLRSKEWALLSFPMTQHWVGQQFFDMTRGRRVGPGFDLAWQWSLGYVVLVCLIALAIVAIVVRRAEMAKA